MKAEADAKSMNAMLNALGAVVRAIVATLPPEQQRVFLVRLLDAADSAEAVEDDLLNAMIQDLVTVGQTEQRPPGRDAAGPAPTR